MTSHNTYSGYPIDNIRSAVHLREGDIDFIGNPLLCGYVVRQVYGIACASPTVSPGEIRLHIGPVAPDGDRRREFHKTVVDVSCLISCAEEDQSKEICGLHSKLGNGLTGQCERQS